MTSQTTAALLIAALALAGRPAFSNEIDRLNEMASGLDLDAAYDNSGAAGGAPAVKAPAVKAQAVQASAKQPSIALADSLPTAAEQRPDLARAAAGSEVNGSNGKKGSFQKGWDAVMDPFAEMAGGADHGNPVIAFFGAFAYVFMIPVGIVGGLISGLLRL